MLSHPLTSFEVQKYHQNEPKLIGVYSRNKLYKIKDGSYKINLDQYESIGTQWIPLYMNAENVTFFDSFAVARIRESIRKFIGNKDAIKNIYRIQAYYSIMRGYFCVEFIDFIRKVKVY